MATPHTLSGWRPGALVFLYPATQEQARAALGEPPRGEPVTGAVADERGAVDFEDAPADVALLAYGARSDGAAGWVLTRAAKSPPRSEPLVGGRSIAQPSEGLRAAPEFAPPPGARSFLRARRRDPRAPDAATGDVLPEQIPRRYKRRGRTQPYRRNRDRVPGPTLTAILRGAPFYLDNPADYQREIQRRARQR
jgi:hypothetical protein